jgi:hypothetical protein
LLATRELGSSPMPRSDRTACARKTVRHCGSPVRPGRPGSACDNPPHSLDAQAVNQRDPTDRAQQRNINRHCVRLQLFLVTFTCGQSGVSPAFR